MLTETASAALVVFSVAVIRSRSAPLICPSHLYWKVASSAMSPSRAPAITAIGTRKTPRMRRS